MMRLNLGNGHKEGFFPIIAVQKFQSHIINTVRPVALKVNTPVIFVKNIAVIAVGGKLQHVCGPPESGVAPAQLSRNGADRVIDCRRLIHLPVAGQMPFADIGGFISRLPEIVGQGLDI